MKTRQLAALLATVPALLVIIAAAAWGQTINYTLKPGQCTASNSCSACLLNYDSGTGHCIALTFSSANSITTKTCVYVSGGTTSCQDTGSVINKPCGGAGTFWDCGLPTNNTCNFNDGCACALQGGNGFTNNTQNAATCNN